MHRLLMLGALAVAVSGCTNRSFEWREEVRLASGESFFMQRSGRVASQGEWAHSSYTRAISMRLELPEAHGALVWEGDQWPISIDRIDGRWWVVIPVQGYTACAAYDFPPEGLVAFSFDGATWSRGGTGPLVDELTANLGAPRLDEGRYNRVAYSWGEKYPRGVAPRLAEWIEPQLRQSDACIKIRRPHDPARDASLAAFAGLVPADRAAVVEAVERDLPPIDKAERDRLWGRWIGAARVRDCSGIVSDIESLDAWDSGGSRLIGRRIQIIGAEPGVARSAYLPQPPDLQSVTCHSAGALVVLRDRRIRRLSIVEYSREAEPVAAWSYRLTELDEWFAGEWGIPVDLADRGNSFTMTLVNDQATTRVHLVLPKDTVPIGPATPLVATPR